MNGPNCKPYGVSYLKHTNHLTHNLIKQLAVFNV